MIQHYHLILRPHSSLVNWSKNNLYKTRCIICYNYCQVSLVSFNLQQFLSLSLSFMTLTRLKASSQLFYRMTINLSLSNLSPIQIHDQFEFVLSFPHDSDAWFLASLAGNDTLSSLHPIRWHMTSISPITDDANWSLKITVKLFFFPL